MKALLLYSQYYVDFVLIDGFQKPPRRIFVSSVMRDFEHERRAIAEAITKSENVPVFAEAIIDVTRNPRKVIEDT